MPPPESRPQSAAEAKLWIGAGLTAIVVWAVVVFLPALVHVAPPAADLQRELIGDYSSSCRPEPLEQLRYLVAIGLAPLCFVAAHAFVARRGSLAPAEATASRGAVIAALVVQVVFGALGLRHAFSVPPDADVAYFDPLELLSAVPAVLVVLSTTTLLWIRDWDHPLARRLRSLPPAVAILIAALFVVSQLAATLYTDANFLLAPRPTAYHLPFPQGEIAAAVNGRVPLVDFYPQYQNLMPLLLRPVFAHVGVGISAFTCVMAVLSMAAFASLFYTLSACAGSAWRALAVFLPCALLALSPAEASRFMRASIFSYFAVGPLRYVGPLVLCAVCAVAARRITPLRTAAAALLAGVVALNNLDFGVPALVATCAALVVASPHATWLSPVQIARTLVTFAIAVVAVVFGYSQVAHALSGAWPSWSEISSYQRIFALTGFMMLPMPSAGLHFVVYATYMAALFRGYVLRSRLAATDDVRARTRAALLIWSGIFGAGAAMYFVGRSHPSSLPALFPAWALAIGLLAVDLGDVWRERERAIAPRPSRALLVLPTFALALELLAGFSLSARMANPSTELERSRLTMPLMQRYMASLKGFVHDHSAPHETLMIASPFGHVMAVELGLDNAYPFASSDSLIARAQLDAVLVQAERRHVQKLFGTLPEPIAAALTEHGFRLVAEVPFDLPGQVITQNLSGQPRFGLWERTLGARATR